MKYVLQQMIHSKKGSAVVEATILFPIIFMIFAGLFLLAVYLPERAVLQWATQYAATGIATARSDSWLAFDEDGYHPGTAPEGTVYHALFSANDADGQEVVSGIWENALASHGEVEVDVDVNNYIIYKEIVVTARRHIQMPVDLSFVRFPSEITLEVSSTAVVQNGDEFIRNMDIAVDFVKYLDQKYQISSNAIFQKVKEVGDKISGFLGI